MSKTVRISQIIWIGEDEAEMVLSDGLHKCRAFCHPCGYREGEAISNRLNVLDVLNVRLSSDSEPMIEQLESTGGLHHRVVGVVSDLDEGSLSKEGAVAVGSFKIQRLQFPGDVRIGDLVEFEVTRLDIC